MSERPFRHLCPEADLRDAMTDDEFWQHVADNLIGPDLYAAGHPDYDSHVSLEATPCVECGETGACAYDAEGRPLIHAATSDDEDAPTP